MAETSLILDQSQHAQKHVLVSVYLRGGADGLHLVPPVRDKDYRKARPSLAVDETKALRLDETFSLHPELAGLHKIFEAGDLAIVHQCGTEENSRSHFEAEDYLHYGGRVGGGWLGRFLHLTKSSDAGPLAALSIGESVSDALQGTAAVALRSLEDFALPNVAPAWTGALASLYQKAGGALGKTGGETLLAMERIKALVRESKKMADQQGGRAKNSFDDGLQLIARLVRADVGLRAATIELGGWDSHIGQGAMLTTLMKQLNEGLTRFHESMGDDHKHVTVIIMTEFGRRVGENASLGTDHGRGSVHMVMGGGVTSNIFSRWEGLSSSLLEYPGDVPVQFDYRQVLLPVLHKAHSNFEVSRMFPGFSKEGLPLFG